MGDQEVNLMGYIDPPLMVSLNLLIHSKAVKAITKEM